MVVAIVCGHATVVADFTATQSCDSAAIRVMLLAQRLSAANQIALRLVVPPGAAERAFERADDDRVLPIYPTLSQALRLSPHSQPDEGV